MLVKGEDAHMGKTKGVFKAIKKDGSEYYRASITYKNKHISLGSFETELEAFLVYKEADLVLHDNNQTIDQFDSEKCRLPFAKRVCLVNYRDNNMYFKTPIYLRKNYFTYHLSPKEVLKFDIDDLFFYSTRTIMKRQGHLFVADYGMQINLPSRYGIKNYAVYGEDYYFRNHDLLDYRYENIVILNRYNGVIHGGTKNKELFTARLHINGNVVIGHYETEQEAAVAYNKGADFASKHGLKRNYQKNYIDGINEEQYDALYNKVALSDGFIKYFIGE